MAPITVACGDWVAWTFSKAFGSKDFLAHSESEANMTVGCACDLICNDSMRRHVSPLLLPESESINGT